MSQEKIYFFEVRKDELRRILATSLANFEEESLDGDSLASQSRLDAHSNILYELPP